MRAKARRLGVLLGVLAGLLILGGLATPAFAQTQLTCAEVGGTCRTLDEGPAGGEVLDNSGSCAFEGGPIKKCYAPAVCEERGGACQVGATVCTSDTTKLGNASCSSGPCCTLPTAGATCGELLGHENGICSIYSDSCPSGYVNRGPTKDPCLSCCELATAPPPPPAPPEGEEYRVEYLHTDALGSVRLVTDQTGAVVSRQDYYPFGEKISAGANSREFVSVDYSESPNLRQKFTGKERDGESGLDYYGARYYSSAQGRFTSADTFNPILEFEARKGDDEEAEEAEGGFRLYINEPQNWNRYAYGFGNPLRFTDPDGRAIPLLLYPAATAIGAAIASPAGQRALIQGSAYLQRFGPQVQRVLASSGQHISNTVFQLDRFTRGRVIETLRGSTEVWRNTLCMDCFEKGVATSIKSLDIFAKSYQSVSALSSRISGYVTQLENYAGGQIPGRVLGSNDVTRRVLEIILPKGALSQGSLDALRRAQQQALSRGVEIKYFQAQ